MAALKGYIITSDQQFFPDSHFRSLLWKARDYALTIVSDSLIEPAENSVCHSPGMPRDIKGDTERFYKKHPKTKYICMGYMGFAPTNLSPVDIHKEDTTCIAQILKMLSGLLNSIFLPVPNPNPSSILLNAFQCEDQKAREEGARPYDIPELFIPPPHVASSIIDAHRLYGGFTTTMLDIIEETQGQVTNVELAQKAMQKLRMQGIWHKPGLHCNDHRAYAPFIGGNMLT